MIRFALVCISQNTQLFSCDTSFEIESTEICKTLYAIMIMMLSALLPDTDVCAFFSLQTNIVDNLRSPNSCSINVLMCQLLRGQCKEAAITLYKSCVNRIVTTHSFGSS